MASRAERRGIALGTPGGQASRTQGARGKRPQGPFLTAPALNFQRAPVPAQPHAGDLLLDASRHGGAALWPSPSDTGVSLRTRHDDPCQPLLTDLSISRMSLAGAYRPRAVEGPVGCEGRSAFQVKKRNGSYPRVRVGGGGRGGLAGRVGAAGRGGPQVRPGPAIPAGLTPWRKQRAVHDPGEILLDAALAVALGGDCLADIGVLRAEPGVSGPVASDPTVSRLVDALPRFRPEGPCGLRLFSVAVRIVSTGRHRLPARWPRTGPFACARAFGCFCCAIMKPGAPVPISAHSELISQDCKSRSSIDRTHSLHRR